MSLDVAQLRNMMAQDANAIATLKQLLLRERELLETRNQDELAVIVEQKSQVVDLLNQHAQIRQTLLRNLGLAANAEGWDLFLQRNTLTLPLRDDWKQIIQDFSECQALNDINGKMIARSRQTLDHLLNLLRGQVATPSLYTAMGPKLNTMPLIQLPKPD
jgi:flagella synthesis protein FlgN